MSWLKLPSGNYLNIAHMVSVGYTEQGEGDFMVDFAVADSQAENTLIALNYGDPGDIAAIKARLDRLAADEARRDEQAMHGYGVRLREGAS